jgi:glucan phosphoethanolaminetransferase (alkaline phosphatase superfamily)
MSRFRRQTAYRSFALGLLLSALMIVFDSTCAFANGLGAGIGFVPGLTPLDPLCGPLLTVAIAIIERPFFTRSGLTPWALIYSLRANFASYLLGIVVALIYLSVVQSVHQASFDTSGEFLLIGLPVLLVVLTIWFEQILAVQVFAKGRELRPRWILVGNIVSNLALLALAAVLDWVFTLIGIRVHHFIFFLEKLTMPLVVAYLLILVGAILLVIGVPLWSILPRSLQRGVGVPDQDRRPTASQGSGESTTSFDTEAAPQAASSKVG